MQHESGVCEFLLPVRGVLPHYNRGTQPNVRSWTPGTTGAASGAAGDSDASRRGIDALGHVAYCPHVAAQRHVCKLRRNCLLYMAIKLQRNYLFLQSVCSAVIIRWCGLLDILRVLGNSQKCICFCMLCTAT